MCTAHRIVVTFVTWTRVNRVYPRYPALPPPPRPRPPGRVCAARAARGPDTGTGAARVLDAIRKSLKIESDSTDNYECCTCLTFVRLQYNVQRAITFS